MADKLSSNFSCLDAAFTTYHTCVTEMTFKATPSWESLHFNTAVTVLTAIATGIFVLSVVFSFVKAASKSSVRQELYDLLEVVICLFTAQLSFASLIMNSIWMFGQVLASVCDLLTLNTR